MDILEERNDLHQIWFCHFENYNETHGNIEKLLYKNVEHTATGVGYRRINLPAMDSGWCGFSWNAGLRRTIDYKTMFPEGMAMHVKNNDVGSHAECWVNKHAMACGYQAAHLLNTACKDMGRRCSTYK